MNAPVQFKKISDETFRIHYTTGKLIPGSLYFIMSANGETSITYRDGDLEVVLQAGQIWLAKTSSEVQLHTNSINKIEIKNTLLSVTDDLGKTINSDLKDLVPTWVEEI